ncbi:MAG: hypothetical protein ILP24_03175 [Paludibacteraceae bacterium]|nr:hypothetical protein [Paludibacteraceae bacterium]
MILTKEDFEKIKLPLSKEDYLIVNEADWDYKDLRKWNMDLALAYTEEREQEYLTEIENDPAFYGANHLEIVVPDKHKRR